MTTQFVAFSGGIDSTALALMLPDATPVFTDTGDEFDELLAHVEKFERVTGRAIVRIQGRVVDEQLIPQTLPEYVQEAKFLPNHGARFCTRMFKIEPMNWWLKQRLPAELCIGLRADEPADERVGNLTQLDGLGIRYPLREAGWTRTDCIRMCLTHDLLPRNPVYMARGGCKGCFYKRKAEVKAMVQLVPHVVDELQAREEAVQDERGRYFHMFPNAGASIADIRAQPALFDLSEVYRAAGDSSDKGEACGLFCHR